MPRAKGASRSQKGASDILHKTEKFQQETGDAFRRLLESSPYGIILVEPAGVIVLVNAMAEKLFGYTRKELVGQPVEQLVPPGFRHHHQYYRGEYTRAPRVRPMGSGRDLFALRKDGSEFPVEIALNPLALKGETYVLATVSDISPRKRMEKERSYLASMVDSARDAILSKSLDGVINYWNPGCEKLYGYSAAEMVGRNIRIMVPSEKVREHDDILHRTAKGEFIEKLETIRRKKDGRMIDVSLSISPIFDERRTVMGACTIARDITEMKRQFAVLKYDREHLQKISHMKTEELKDTRARLKKAQRLSDIGTLAATVAHELRNPLGVIRTAVYNMRRKRGDAPIVRHLDNIDKKVKESDHIISNLLNYTRIKAPSFRKVNLHSHLSECLDTAKNRFSRQDVKILREIEGIKEIEIEADPFQLMEVFHNIINNAYEAMIDKKGRLSVRASRQDDGTVLVQIKDNGTGIEQDDLDMVCEPFFTRKSKGTGLGLSICNEMIHLHDGQLFIESQKGKGTTVTISLPVERKQDGK